MHGDLITDEYLAHFIRLKKLRSLTILGPSRLTMDGIFQFLDVLISHRSDYGNPRKGLRIAIQSQKIDAHLDKGEVEWISKSMKRDFGGTFDITYDTGGDEMDEDDYSYSRVLGFLGQRSGAGLDKAVGKRFA